MPDIVIKRNHWLHKTVIVDSADRSIACTRGQRNPCLLDAAAST
ncbi:hypothetical protein [Dyella monticola]|nr:hypothetical protein [Dyella monticola]